MSIGGVKIPLYLISDSAHPLKSWLMKLFTYGSSLNTEQKTYNYRICRAHIVIENTYGLLNGRWHRLIKRNDMCIDNITTTVSAACISHNMCKVHGDNFNKAWLTDDESSFPQPVSTTTQDENNDQPKVIRNALVTYFST